MRDRAGLESSPKPLASFAEGNRGERESPDFDEGRCQTRAATEVLSSPGESGRPCDVMGSSCGDGKGRVAETARPLRLQCSDCEILLHELSNVITGVLMNAQVLQWKLPPYSHLKRSVREVERNAQRGSELLKRLMRPLAHVAPESSAAVPGELVSTLPAGVPGEPGRERNRGWPADLTGWCDPCTSGVFPKRDDSNKC